MALKWLQGKVVDDDKEASVEFKPEEFEARVQEGVKKQFEAFTTQMAETLNPVAEFLRAQKKDKDTAEAAELAARNKQNLSVDDNDFILDPQAAVRKMNQPVATLALQLAAKDMRREMLDGKDYYHGEIKAKIDSLLAKQNLNAQNDPSVIENAYKVVVFDNLKDINEGKIKTQTASFNMRGNSAEGKNDSDGGEREEDMSAEEKKYAAKLGISEADWKKSRRELEYV